jgi:hypothetical protein
MYPASIAGLAIPLEQVEQEQCPLLSRPGFQGIGSQQI